MHYLMIVPDVDLLGGDNISTLTTMTTTYAKAMSRRNTKCRTKTHLPNLATTNHATNDTNTTVLFTAQTTEPMATSSPITTVPSNDDFASSSTLAVERFNGGTARTSTTPSTTTKTTGNFLTYFVLLSDYILSYSRKVFKLTHNFINTRYFIKTLKLFTKSKVLNKSNFRRQVEVCDLNFFTTWLLLGYQLLVR